MSDDSKKATFLSTVGASTYEKVKELLSPQTIQQTSYAVIIEKLIAHYKPQCIEIAERFKFFKRHQGSGESIADFEAGLRKLGSTCNFGAYLETALRDQFVCGLSDTKCQQDLLCSSDLSLTSAVQAAKAREAVLREAELFGAATGATAAAHRVARAAVLGGSRQRSRSAELPVTVSLVGVVGKSTRIRAGSGRTDATCVAKQVIWRGAVLRGGAEGLTQFRKRKRRWWPWRTSPTSRQSTWYSAHR